MLFSLLTQDTLKHQGVRVGDPESFERQWSQVQPGKAKVYRLWKNTVAIGHWETLNGHGGKVRLVCQRIPAKCQGILAPLGARRYVN
jgi:hypothetical protein